MGPVLVPLPAALILLLCLPLLRCTGLWSAGSGCISVPADTFFLPQRPYMPLGTLREQLTFPDSYRPAVPQQPSDGKAEAAGQQPDGASGKQGRRRGGGSDSDSGDEDVGAGEAPSFGIAGSMRRLLGPRGGAAGSARYLRMSSSTSGGSGGGSARLQAAVDGTAVGGGGGGSEAGSGLRGCCSSRSSSPELEAELRQLLDTVCLPYLDSRVGGLDADLDWSHVLSLGEQQRLSFARLLHRRPACAFLDEATSGEARRRAELCIVPCAACNDGDRSCPHFTDTPLMHCAALDTTTEAALYTALQQHCRCFLSIAHRRQLAAYHTHVLEGLGDGRWQLHTAAEFLRLQTPQ